MKTYHVEINGSANSRTINCASSQEAEKVWSEASEAGTPATAYYVENEKVFDLFTEEEIETEA